ncbi:MAG TPA: hypothetical protein VFG76_06820 [Candidatus Polarisedimenticolia bacterium]|nr:hypothetical protein [Candidatus Polarisedimenticolia bacterium]
MIDEWAPKIEIPGRAQIDPRCLLHGMTGNESRFGEIQFTPRFEPNYYRGGRYYLKPANEWLRRAVTRYEQCAAMSWGAWQIMYPTAVELGYDGHPWGLSLPEECIRWVVAYLNRRTYKEWDDAPRAILRPPALTVEQSGDSYNTGNHWDDVHNAKYERELRENYDKAAAFYEGRKTEETP